MRILFVEDEPDIREVAALSLRIDPELDVRTCATGTEALAIAPKWLPTLIMLDVMMPGMDGAEILAALRKDMRTRSIPIVFITARTQAADVTRLLALGAEGVIAKPFDPLRLAQQVRQFIEESSR